MSRWRRSIQLRIVTTTLLVSSAVVTILGFVVLHQVSSGVLEAKTNAARAEARAGFGEAADQVKATDRTDDAAVASLLDDLIGRLSRRGGSAGLYELVIVSETATPGRRTNDIEVESVPARLKARVAAGYQASTFTRMRYESGRSLPGYVVGSPLAIGGIPSYSIYYLFPLNQEQDTISLVRRTALVAGFVLVLLLAAIVGLVTRQVVTPVRLAARTAQRLAAGRLEERLQPKGEDDLARLATSFNTMAEALQRQIRRLEELSRMQRRFVSDVSHELRTPLTTIRMAADVLHEARSGFDPAVSRSAELLQTQIDRFEALLVDLLEISRHDAGAAVLEAEPVDLRAVVQRVVETCLPLAQRRGGTIEVELPAQEVVAEVDPRRVERILRNLIGNALEHGEGRPVEVAMDADKDAVAMTVRDHGVGLRPGETSLVFSRFWRADPARARSTGGTGLGLSIALEDAHLHGGWLQAWGEPGQGSQFRLTLPLLARKQLRASPLPLQPGDAPGRLRGRHSGTGADSSVISG
ncbi:MAG: two-component system, OmpR family, sensor histidine kinase MtrB [Frankiaceae bacterium]|nr:two-component system, OmpR family, sensor histidine kinase MtrB [Frankiaceae bacterium]